jgi:hypothetical protein
MPEVIEIEKLRKEIEQEFIGFSPATLSVKPVHIANGLFRGVLEYVSDTGMLFKFIISQSQKGEVLDGHELNDVYALLKIENRLDSRDVKQENIPYFRNVIKKNLAADSAVYAEKGMESYTAGNAHFISRDRIAQDGGELVANWLRKINSPLFQTISEALYDDSDIITILSLPLLSYTHQPFIPNQFDYDHVRFLNQQVFADAEVLHDGLASAAIVLNDHLKVQKNKLFRLRQAVLFANFFLIRHLSVLEASYIPEASDRLPAILLDFSSDNNQPIARASHNTYLRICQSISRFYAWAFGWTLHTHYTLDQLQNEVHPSYKKKMDTKEMVEIWDLAKKEANNSSQPFVVFGQALYDIMALEAEASPIGYIKKLSLLSGLLYPPNQSTQRFNTKEDFLEMLIRGVIPPGQSVNMDELQNRLWDHYRIIVGGLPRNEDILKSMGIYQVDNKSLRDNLENFAKALSRLNFARLLADGVLQVETEISDVA